MVPLSQQGSRGSVNYNTEHYFAVVKPICKRIVTLYLPICYHHIGRDVLFSMIMKIEQEVTAKYDKNTVIIVR